MAEAIEGGGVALMRVVDGGANKTKGSRDLIGGGAEDEDTRDVKKGSGVGDGGRPYLCGDEKIFLPVRRGKPDRATVPSDDGVAGGAGDVGADERVPVVAVHETALTVNA